MLERAGVFDAVVLFPKVEEKKFALEANEKAMFPVKLLAKK